MLTDHRKRGLKVVRKAFRDSYSKLGMLRTLLPNVNMLALTATADKDLEKKIVKSLSMQSFTMIRASPNRLNIHLMKVKCPTLNPSLLEWIVEGLRKQKRNFEKTIIYCQSIENVSKVFLFLKEELGREAFDILSREKSTNNMLIGMYHKMTLHENKERVLAQLSDVDGSCRVVVATTSLVMGVDISDLRYVIHYGAPYEVIDYIQGIGRAGRDGAAATAILYYSGRQLAKATAEMKAYATETESCLRVALYKSFVTQDVRLPEVKHDCCSWCHAHCDCKGSGMCAMPFLNLGEGMPKVSRQGEVRTVSKPEKHLFKEVFLDYVSQQNRKYANVTSFFDKQFFVGISKSVTKELQGHLPFITSIEYILSHTPIYKEHHAGEIVLIVHDIYGDITDIEVSKAQNAARDRNEEVQSLSLPEWLFYPNSDADSTSGSDKSDLSDGIEGLDVEDDW